MLRNASLPGIVASLGFLNVQVWGVGVNLSDVTYRTPACWRGCNVLGYALMQARARLREETGSNYGLIDCRKQPVTCEPEPEPELEPEPGKKKHKKLLPSERRALKQQARQARAKK